MPQPPRGFSFASEALDEAKRNHEEARTWYDKAVPWMDKHAPKDAELRQFRNEAEALLVLKKD